MRRTASTLERRGIIAVILVRKLPAPFTLINLLCGARPVTLRDFLLGTLLGVGTGTQLITVLGARRPELACDPTLGSIASALARLLAPHAVTLVLPRRLDRVSRGSA